MAARKPVRDFMSPLPHTIGVDQSLALAHRRMANLGVRHLPVLDGGHLVGVLSSRDIDLLEGLASVDAERLLVDEAMSSDVFQVAPDTPFAVVARSMAERKVGSAIVVEEHRPVGIVTTTDALQTLADLLALSGDVVPEPSPAHLRRRVLDEHRLLRALFEGAEAVALRCLDGDSEAHGELARRAREIYQSLLRHMDLEDEILVPFLRSVDAFGEERAKALAAEHIAQREVLFSAIGRLSEESAEELAGAVLALGTDVRADMEREEALFLNERLMGESTVRVSPGS